MAKWDFRRIRGDIGVWGTWPVGRLSGESPICGCLVGLPRDKRPDTSGLLDVTPGCRTCRCRWSRHRRKNPIRIPTTIRSTRSRSRNRNHWNRSWSLIRRSRSSPIRRRFRCCLSPIRRSRSLRSFRCRFRWSRSRCSRSSHLIRWSWKTRSTRRSQNRCPEWNRSIHCHCWSSCCLSLIHI